MLTFIAKLPQHHIQAHYLKKTAQLCMHIFNISPKFPLLAPSQCCQLKLHSSSYKCQLDYFTFELLDPQSTFSLGSQYWAACISSCLSTSTTIPGAKRWQDRDDGNPSSMPCRWPQSWHMDAARGSQVWTVLKPFTLACPLLLPQLCSSPKAQHNGTGREKSRSTL